MNLKGRIRRMELRLFADEGISKEDRLVIIHYKKEDEMNRLVTARMDELSEKYEREILEEDVLVICLKDYSGD